MLTGERERDVLLLVLLLLKCGIDTASMHAPASHDVSVYTSL